jgi:putative addiction module component (TIGR02574 family)
MITSPFSLSIPERIKLVEALWDSIAHEQAALSLLPEHQKELDLRLEAYSKDHLKGRLSHQVLADIWKKL